MACGGILLQLSADASSCRSVRVFFVRATQPSVSGSWKRGGAEGALFPDCRSAACTWLQHGDMQPVAFLEQSTFEMLWKSSHTTCHLQLPLAATMCQQHWMSYGSARSLQVRPHTCIAAARPVTASRLCPYAMSHGKKISGRDSPAPGRRGTEQVHGA